MSYCQKHNTEYTGRCKACRAAVQKKYRQENPLSKEVAAERQARNYQQRKARMALRADEIKAQKLAKAAAALPPGVTIHRMEDSKRHTSVARKSLPARGMASSEY